MLQKINCDILRYNISNKDHQSISTASDLYTMIYQSTFNLK